MERTLYFPPLTSRQSVEEPSLPDPTHLAEFHRNIVLQILGGLGPGFFVATLEAASKLLQNSDSPGHGGSRSVFGASSPVGPSRQRGKTKDIQTVKEKLKLRAGLSRFHRLTAGFPTSFQREAESSYGFRTPQVVLGKLCNAKTVY